jgi:hypothetical protein
MEVKVFKLVSGESIIGQLSSEHKKTLTITNPVMIDLQMTENGLGIGFLPWIPYCKEENEVTISIESVMIILTPIENVLKQYNSLFSNIFVPDSSPKLKLI